jgi:hypothetical protein
MQVSFAIGQTFKQQIHASIMQSDLNSTLLPFYNTPDGHDIVMLFHSTVCRILWLDDGAHMHRSSPPSRCTSRRFEGWQTVLGCRIWRFENMSSKQHVG